MLKKRERLSGVHPQLIKVVEEAAETFTHDIQVLERLRTLKRQKELVASGASQTLKSKHLIQTDGFGYAVDLLPLQKDGSIDWKDTSLFDALVHHMLRTASAMNVRIRSGADWDMDGVIDATQIEVYRKRHGKAPFVDRPHYELV